MPTSFSPFSPFCLMSENMELQQIKINEIEARSAIWLKLETWANERIIALRKRNDGDLSEIATAKLRGKIAALNELLDLAKPNPIIKTSDH